MGDIFRDTTKMPTNSNISKLVVRVYTDPKELPPNVRPPGGVNEEDKNVEHAPNRN